MDLYPFEAYEIDGARGGRVAVQRKASGYSDTFPGVDEFLFMHVWIVPEPVRSFTVWITGGATQIPGDVVPTAVLYNVPTQPGEAWGFDPGWSLFTPASAVATYRNVFSGGHGGVSRGTAGCGASALVRFPSGVVDSGYDTSGGSSIFESLDTDWELWAVVAGKGGAFDYSVFAGPGPFAAGPVPYPATMLPAHSADPDLTGEFAERPAPATDFDSGGGGGGFYPGEAVHLGPGISGTGLLPPNAADMGGRPSPRLEDVAPEFMPAEGPEAFVVGTLSLAYWVEQPGGWHFGRIGWGPGGW